ncbi:hypothetical protein [Brucella sp. IR068]
MLAIMGWADSKAVRRSQKKTSPIRMRGCMMTLRMELFNPQIRKPPVKKRVTSWLKELESAALAVTPVTAPMSG